MRILGVLIIILYLILLLTGIYCTFAANVPEPPESQPVSANNGTQESSESNTSLNSPGSVFASYIFFPYPVIAPNNAFGQMIRNFFRNNTFGAGWVPVPMLMSVMNSTKSVMPPMDSPLAPEYPAGSPRTTTVSSNPSTSTPPSDPVYPNNGSTVSTNSSTV